MEESLLRVKLRTWVCAVVAPLSLLRTGVDEGARGRAANESRKRGTAGNADGGGPGRHGERREDARRVKGSGSA